MCTSRDGFEDRGHLAGRRRTGLPLEDAQIGPHQPIKLILSGEDRGWEGSSCSNSCHSLSLRGCTAGIAISGAILGPAIFRFRLGELFTAHIEVDRPAGWSHLNGRDYLPEFSLTTHARRISIGSGACWRIEFWARARNLVDAPDLYLAQSTR